MTDKEDIYAPNTSISKTWEITPALRFVRKPTGKLILQQAYWSREVNETEWRDVPIADD